MVSLPIETETTALPLAASDWRVAGTAAGVAVSGGPAANGWLATAGRVWLSLMTPREYAAAPTPRTAPTANSTGSTTPRRRRRFVTLLGNWSDEREAGVIVRIVPFCWRAVGPTGVIRGLDVV